MCNDNLIGSNNTLFMNELNNVKGMIPIAKLTEIPKPALRLFLSILMGYPIAFIHHIVVGKCNPLMQHIYFATCGLLLCIFNYGYDSYHCLISIWMTYLLGRLLHNAPKQFLILNFIFHMGYLLAGYCLTESSDYDIVWTMPHCVLVLRLIGLGFDIADGCKSHEQLSKDQKETALSNIPTLIELTAYTLFPASFLIGPQFPFKRYQRFIRGEFQQHGGCIHAGLIRGAIGIMYLIARQFGTAMLPDKYFLTETFRNKPMSRKLIEIGIWGKISLYKYISCWLLVEGALMCTGFTYAGKTKDGKPDWSGCSNVKLVLLETGSKMTHYVQSFNVNTNIWVAQYIYKRLKFLNKRMLSYILTLTFLAVWHGFHIGYYMAFFMEFSIITVEKEVETIYNEVMQSRYCDDLVESRLYKIILFTLLKTYNIVYMGWCLLPFIMLKYERWIQVYAALNYFGFIVLGLLILFIITYKLAKSSRIVKKSLISKQN